MTGPKYPPDFGLAVTKAVKVGVARSITRFGWASLISAKGVAMMGSTRRDRKADTVVGNIVVIVVHLMLSMEM
jgi:hypothetical protein